MNLLLFKQVRLSSSDSRNVCLMARGKATQHRTHNVSIIEGDLHVVSMLVCYLFAGLLLFMLDYDVNLMMKCIVRGRIKLVGQVLQQSDIVRYLYWHGIRTAQARSYGNCCKTLPMLLVRFQWPVGWLELWITQAWSVSICCVVAAVLLLSIFIVLTQKFCSAVEL